MLVSLTFTVLEALVLGVSVCAQDRDSVLIYELGDFLKNKTDNQTGPEHLLLAAFDAVQVHVASLYVREEQLCGAAAYEYGELSTTLILCVCDDMLISGVRSYTIEH